MSEDYFSPMNTMALNTENYDSVTTGYIPQDETKICRFFRADGKCYKGKRVHFNMVKRFYLFQFLLGIKCDQLHSNPDKNVFTQDQIEVLIDLPSLPPLILGSLVYVQVTCIASAFRFYCVLPHGTTDLQNVSTNENDEFETLESLQVRNIAIQINSLVN